MSGTLLLIDLSALAHQVWHSDTANPNPSRVSTQIVARVRALASAHTYAAICCDSGKSWRADVDPAYKAQRDTENRAPLRHQMTLACETLAKDGFPVWASPGAEADDIIATAVRLTREHVPEADVLIVTADKDLLQLVTEHVSVKNLMTGNVAGPADVFDKFGVKPEQMTDLLCLMGDASDNIKGAEKIGKVIAARLLSEHGTLDALYGKMAHGVVSGVTPAMRTNLMEFATRRETVRKLVALKDDVEIPFHEIAVERTAAPMTTDGDEFIGEQSMAAFMEEDNRERPSLLSTAEAAAAGNGDERVTMFAVGRELNQNEALSALGGATQRVAERIQSQSPVGGTPPVQAASPAVAGPVERTPSVPNGGGSDAIVAYQGPVDFSQQLEPRNMTDAVQLAQRMFESRLFGDYGTPQAVLATLLAGRELGIPAMASLRAFHIIEGKPTLSAGTIQSLVLKSGRAKYFRCTERTAERATFVTKRGDDPEMALTYTIEEGKAAWPKDAAAFAKSGWGRNPADMLVARASSKLARLVYPDVVSGLYAPEEME